MTIAKEAALAALALALAACSSNEDSGGKGDGSGGSAGASGSGGAAGAGGSAGSGGSLTGPAWEPGVTYAVEPANAPRGFVEARGLIHAHSVYSHDACDGEPWDASFNINEPCYDDLRRGICQAKHDFVMLSDHRELFTDTEFPDVLLYREELGDQLVMRGGGPVASWMSCPDGEAPALIMAGCEPSDLMPVGLEGHVSTDPSERSRVYASADPADLQTMRDQNAVILLAHTENWTADQLVAAGHDGFEMYNLHANLFLDIASAVDIIVKLGTPEELPHPDLIVMPIISEDPAYLDTWGTVLARGEKRVTTMGTDSHRNSFPQELQDGERVDSFRRMMIWFSNHLLVQPESDGTWDDSHLKQALKAGRLFGVFEFLGFADGFDYHALEGGGAREMGSEVSLANGVTLEVAMPSVRHLDPGAEQPALTIRILKAKEGGWDEVHSSDSDVSFTVTEAGAYRAEVRMVPRHLEPYLSSFAADADGDFAWIYSNPIYVTP